MFRSRKGVLPLSPHVSGYFVSSSLFILPNGYMNRKPDLRYHLPGGRKLTRFWLNVGSRPLSPGLKRRRRITRGSMCENISRKHPQTKLQEICGFTPPMVSLFFRLHSRVLDEQLTLLNSPGSGRRVCVTRVPLPSRANRAA